MSSLLRTRRTATATATRRYRIDPSDWQPGLRAKIDLAGTSARIRTCDRRIWARVVPRGSIGSPWHRHVARTGSTVRGRGNLRGSWTGAGEREASSSVQQRPLADHAEGRSSRSAPRARLPLRPAPRPLVRGAAVGAGHHDAAEQRHARRRHGQRIELDHPRQRPASITAPSPIAHGPQPRTCGSLRASATVPRCALRAARSPSADRYRRTSSMRGYYTADEIGRDSAATHACSRRGMRRRRPCVYAHAFTQTGPPL